MARKFKTGRFNDIRWPYMIPRHCGSNTSRIPRAWLITLLGGSTNFLCIRWILWLVAIQVKTTRGWPDEAEGDVLQLQMQVLPDFFSTTINLEYPSVESSLQNDQSLRVRTPIPLAIQVMTMWSMSSLGETIKIL